MRFRVGKTRNFEANLLELEDHSERHEATTRFDRLLEDLATRLLPLLEETPGVGAPFRAEHLHSPEALFVLERMMRKLKGHELRQVVSGPFLVLYLVGARSVHLLAVRHHRQHAFRLG